MNKILLDTNVLIYSVDEESKYVQKAQYVIFKEDKNLYTTSKNISEFLAVITRFPGNSLELKDALRVIDDFRTLFTITYPIPKSFQISMDLLAKYEPKGLLIDDFEIINIVLAHQIETIAIFNIRDYKRATEINLYLIPYRYILDNVGITLVKFMILNSTRNTGFVVILGYQYFQQHIARQSRSDEIRNSPEALPGLLFFLGFFLMQCRKNSQQIALLDFWSYFDIVQ